MATGYEKYVQRVGHTDRNSKMSKDLPKPNVCRIEVMDGEARRAYMGGMSKTLDTFRETMYENLTSNYDLYEPFYGILNTESKAGPSFEVKAGWTQPKNDNKSGFARMNTILTDNGKSGLIGALSGNVAGKVNSVLSGIENVAQLGMDLSGVNNNCTGSMTIKKFTGATINATLPLKFQWYLPEQEAMCRQSLKRLIMMTYVRPMDMSGYEIVNKTIEALINAGGTLADETKSMVSDLITGEYRGSGFTPTNSTSSYKDGNATSSNSKETSEGGIIEKGVEIMKRVTGLGVGAYNSLNTFFGGEITANPLPVRVSIGHYLDLEPMVIDSVKIYSSTEQFVSADGTHLPIFMNADVTVSYWMQPGPTKDFISVLGNEVFGQFVEYPEGSNLAKNNKAANLTPNNNPAKNKKR